MKNFLKRILIPPLTRPPLSILGNQIFRNGIPVFMLHRIQSDDQPNAEITPEYLRRCLQYLVDEGYQFLSLEEIVRNLINQQDLPPKTVTFTLDDGFLDQVDVAAPIFLEYNCPATFFVITGMLDHNLWPWDAKVSHLINTTKKSSISVTLADEEFCLSVSTEQNKQEVRNIIRDMIKSMSAEDIDQCLDRLMAATECTIPQSPPVSAKPMDWNKARELEKQGIKFAPHTMSHRMLSKLDKSSARSEIISSWQRVKEELAAPSPLFAYPTGRYCDYGPREIEILKQAGFIGAVSTLTGKISSEDTSPNYMYNLPRLSLPGEFCDFVKSCSWIEQAKSKSHQLLQ